MTLGAAGIAAFAHSAQRRSSALDNGAPRVRLCRRQRVGAPVRCARAQDAGQREPLHGRSVTTRSAGGSMARTAGRWRGSSG